VKAMVAAWIHGDVDILPRLLPLLHQRTPRGDGRIVIVRTMKNPHRPATDLVAVEKGVITEGIKRQVGRKLHMGWSMQTLKTREGGIETYHPTFREPHNGNARRVDTGMRGEQFQGAIGVKDHGHGRQLALVLDRVANPPPREAIHDERRYADTVEPGGPLVVRVVHATRPVHQQYRGHTPHGRPWQLEVTRNDRGDAVLRSRQELRRGEG